MRWIRGPVNAVLVATLVKPVSRWMIARLRRRARDRAEEAIIVPAHEFLGSALPSHLALTDQSLPSANGAAIDELPGRGVLRTALIATAVAVMVAAVVWGLVSLRRRRSATASQPEVVAERVAVPIEVADQESEEIASLEPNSVPSEA